MTNEDNNGIVLSPDGKTLERYTLNEEQFEVPEGVEQIADACFEDQDRLRTVILPSTLREYGDSFFCDCPLLETIILKEGTQEFDFASFAYFKHLRTLQLPSTLKELHNCDSLVTCPSLKDIRISDSNPYFTFDGVTIFNKDKTELVAIVDRDIEEYSIPFGIKVIPEQFFDACEKLTRVEIPPTVETICEFAFNQCSALTTVTIPSSVNYIGDYAFNCCTNLQHVEIPSSVTHIGKGIFNWCPNIQQ